VILVLGLNLPHYFLPILFSGSSKIGVGGFSYFSFLGCRPQTSLYSFGKKSEPTERKRERERERETEREREKVSEREREKESERKRGRERERDGFPNIKLSAASAGAQS
jgi:hypothetical protein